MAPQAEAMDRFVAIALLAMTDNTEERTFLLASASIPPNLFHSATAMRSRLKLWNESGTKRARIADSYPNPIRSPQHLALKRFGGH